MSKYYGSIPIAPTNEVVVVVDDENNTHNNNNKGTSSSDHSFEEYDVNYVQTKILTKKERWTKFILIVVPIFIAILFLGGFGWWISHALAPSTTDHVWTTPTATTSSTTKTSSVDSSTSSTVKDPFVSPSSSTMNDGTKIVGPTSSSSSSTTTAQNSEVPLLRSCTKNSKCANLGLTGNCCPTDDVVMLGCCGGGQR